MNTHDRNRVAVKAFVSVRSVERYLAGKSMTAAVQRAIESAMRSLGLGEHVRPASAPTNTTSA